MLPSNSLLPRLKLTPPFLTPVSLPVPDQCRCKGNEGPWPVHSSFSLPLVPPPHLLFCFSKVSLLCEIQNAWNAQNIRPAS